MVRADSRPASHFAEPDAIRRQFAAAMEDMYRSEVPLYGTLVEIVAGVNQSVASPPEPEVRHSAVRVGTAAELNQLARLFAVMGLHPVGYYDLAPAGIPVHSTAFRAITPESLIACPFRVFTSLLRLELIADPELRAEAAAILAGRSIVSAETMALIARAEAMGGLTAAEADEFVAGAVTVFRWHGTARVDAATYQRLLAAHRLVADVVAFHGPHINHLTPHTHDIDAAQAEMAVRGLPRKATIEGPPRRQVPILLRQTSFNALAEPFVPVAGSADAPANLTHTARFGEIEQRGAALTPAGRALYDDCLARSSEAECSLAAAFTAFPDSFTELRRQGLAYARYTARGQHPGPEPMTLEQAFEQGLMTAEPIRYEDFLPVSAAGIFRSNLGSGERASLSANSAQAELEQALGTAILDPFALYRAIEEASRAAALAAVQPGAQALPG